MKEPAPRLFCVWSVALWKTMLPALVKFSIGSPERHCLPSHSLELPHTEHLVKVAILPASVLANPEAQFG